MQIQQLRYFVTLVEKKSFTAAAHEFFISQSALSQQIKALEKELEVALVQRQGRSFDITPAGKLLFHKVQTILSELDSLTSQVQRVNRNLGTSLRLGLLSSMDKDALPDKLKELVCDYIGFELHIIYGSHEELYDLFSNGTLNAFISDSTRLQDSESFSKQALFATRIQVELPRQVELPHRGKHRLKLNLSELTSRNYTFYIVCESEHLLEEQAHLNELLGTDCTFVDTASIAEGRKLILQNPNSALIFDRSLMRGDLSTHSKLKCYTLQNHGKTIKRPMCCYARKNIGLPEINELCAIILSLGCKDHEGSLPHLEILEQESSNPLPNHNTGTGPNYAQGPLIY